MSLSGTSPPAPHLVLVVNLPVPKVNAAYHHTLVNSRRLHILLGKRRALQAIFKVVHKAGTLLALRFTPANLLLKAQ